MSYMPFRMIEAVGLRRQPAANGQPKREFVMRIKLKITNKDSFADKSFTSEIL